MSDDRSEGMTLAELQRSGVTGRVVGPADQRVLGVQHDSRSVKPGDLFVAVPGATHDGARFVADAIDRGAAAAVVETPCEGAPSQLVVADARLALGQVAELVYGKPTEAMPTVGITGTNGKTTTAYLLARAIEGTAGRPAVVGTTGLTVGGEEHVASHTTPEGDDISRFARQAMDGGATHLVLEVSSHGLAMRRVDALTFEVAAFTNLSRDHLDFHGSFAAYGEAKARLFKDLKPNRAVVHVDDPFGADLAIGASMPVVRCSRKDPDAEIFAASSSVTRAGIEATVVTPRGRFALKSPMLGEHNLENLLVALGCVYALDLPLGPAIAAWRDAPGSPGRLERVAHPRDVAVLVDYAHTPDALRRVLQT
ncbi:MAG: UDP-N-acetylmuramoyl-L-alanyl-D-glutamate--2,6-diaminopimelate ligase, partial [Polyangiales bacterium]